LLADEEATSELEFVMRVHFDRRRAFWRPCAVVLTSALLTVSPPVPQQTAAAGQFFFALSPKKQIAVHDFGEEHAFLADSVYDTVNPLILAALPRGTSRVNYRAPIKCVPAGLRAVLSKVSARYGPITVNSTYRSPGKNRKVGGRGKSMHLSCRAIDFRVHGSTRGLMNFLQAQKAVGGFNRYPSGFYHIDNGPRRTW
jgi:uncharacterized protein YcbK (DUF882 family)